jgi:hypothetical protein
MEKPDPYGEWVLFGTKQEAGENPLPIDEDLLAAAREALTHVCTCAAQVGDKVRSDRTARDRRLGEGAPFGCEDPPAQPGSSAAYF